MNEVLLFAEDIIVDSGPLDSSAQAKIYFGTCTKTNQRIVIKQINLMSNSEALVKELQIFQLFISKIA